LRAGGPRSGERPQSKPGVAEADLHADALRAGGPRSGKDTGETNHEPA
jgi:hypothetical protein